MIENREVDFVRIVWGWRMGETGREGKVKRIKICVLPIPHMAINKDIKNRSFSYILTYDIGVISRHIFPYGKKMLDTHVHKSRLVK